MLFSNFKYSSEKLNSAVIYKTKVIKNLRVRVFKIFFGPNAFRYRDLKITLALTSDAGVGLTRHVCFCMGFILISVNSCTNHSDKMEMFLSLHEIKLKYVNYSCTA